MNPIEALFRQLSLGVYIIGAAHNEQRDAFTAAWVMQVSFNPLLLAVSIHPEHASWALVKESRAFTVNVLKQGQLDVAPGDSVPGRAGSTTSLRASAGIRAGVGRRSWMTPWRISTAS